MPKANHAHSTIASRRALFGALPAVALAAIAPSLAQAENDEAELVRTCNRHIAILHTINTDSSEVDVEDRPIYQDYIDTQCLIDEAEPMTLGGLAAKALAAREAAADPDGTHDFAHSCGGRWAEDLVNDLIRLAGRA